MATVLLTDGARDLRTYLLETRQSVPEFCEANGISRQKVQRALNGTWQSITIDFASAVHTATNGAVSILSWSRATRKPAAPHEVGRVFLRRGREPAGPVIAERRAPPVRARSADVTRAAS